MSAITSLLLAAVWLITLGLQWASPPGLRETALALLAAVLMLSVPRAQRASLLVCAPIALAAALLLVDGAPPGALLTGLERSLVFAALLPTLRLTRASVSLLNAVRLSQQRIARLPGRDADAGLLLAAQALGSVLNTGTFALLAAVVERRAGTQRRLAAAQAALRGMNLAVLWSPFFIGFAVAQTYLPSVPAWQLVPLGLTLCLLALGLALALFSRPLSPALLGRALSCMRPLLPPAALAALTVMAVARWTPLHTLGAVLWTLPLLCAAGLAMRPGALRSVLRETRAGLAQTGDELLVIAAAMLLGSLLESAPLIADQLGPWLAAQLPAALVIVTTVALMTGAAVIGIHPMISGVVLLAAFAGQGVAVAELALLEAVLLGWGLGSMVSVSSLSVVTAAALFEVPRWRLAFGPNLSFATLVALLASALLSLLDTLLV